MSLQINNTNESSINYLHTLFQNNTSLHNENMYSSIINLTEKVDRILSQILGNINIICKKTTKINPKPIEFYDIIQILLKKGYINTSYNNNLLNKKKAYEFFISNKDIYDSFLFLNIPNLFSSLDIDDYPAEILNVFISPYVFDEIMKLHNLTKVKTSYKTNNVNIDIYHKDNELNNFQIHNIFLKIYTLIEYYKLSDKSLHIQYFFTDLKKEISYDKHERVLTTSEINSGVTIHYFDKKKIFIFRKEEVEKLSIHEMIHALQIDKNLFDYPKKYDNLIKCHFNINHSNEIRIYEAFTETTAVILNIIIDSILTQQNVCNLVRDEIIFNLFQCKKIMNYYYTTDIFDKHNCSPNNIVWKENTSVLSYFFLKTVGLLNSNYFIDNIIDQPNIDNYYQFLINNSDLLTRYLKNIATNDKSIPSELKTTMRMTINNFIFNYK